MSINWTSKVVRPLARLFQPAEVIPAEFVDRDAERIRRELDLIRIRFPHHDEVGAAMRALYERGWDEYEHNHGVRHPVRWYQDGSLN